MGAWGTSLYSNDSACDIRGDYVDKLKRGKTNEEATQELICENRDIMGDVEEEPLFWFALSDTQWNYGRLLPEVKEKALYFLSRDDELQRWKESGKKQSLAWEKTLEELNKKLNSPQPPEKKVSKYRFYQCKWKLGDVFAYRFSGSYSMEKGFLGQYVIFRKISEDTWWPGHIIPVVWFYKWIGNDIPSVDKLTELGLLPAFCSPSVIAKFPHKKINYEIKLISESEKVIPTDNLTFLGNLPGDDLIPFRGHDYWTNYGPVGWESSKYNEKFEHYVIDMYLAWRDV
ncbi:MAG: hypothetical protein E7617_07125 [Ruminococcaceae bacterium]|nr:hypothetical protein [Oscillospiraceae bacterium]